MVFPVEGVGLAIANKVVVSAITSSELSVVGEDMFDRDLERSRVPRVIKL